jgi:hypothetical protein
MSRFLNGLVGPLRALNPHHSNPGAIAGRKRRRRGSSARRQDVRPPRRPSTSVWITLMGVGRSAYSPRS